MMKTSKGPAPSKCDCIGGINGLLIQHNSKLVIAYNAFNEKMPDSMPTIMTEKIETKKKGKAQIVVPSYCPFCGVRYDQSEEDEAK